MGLTESFGFEERWMRMLIKRIPDYPDLFEPSKISDAQSILGGLGNRQVLALRDWGLGCEILVKQPNGTFSLNKLGRILHEHDPDLEELGSFWAIHHNLCMNIKGIWFYSVYSNSFGAGRFTRSDIKERLLEHKKLSNSMVEKKCMTPLLHTMRATKLGRELGILFQTDDELYERQVPKDEKLHPGVLSYMLLDWAMRNNRRTANIVELTAYNSVGGYLALDQLSLIKHLTIIQSHYSDRVIQFSQTAGLNSITFNDDLIPSILLRAYYVERASFDCDPLKALNRAAAMERAA